MPPRGCPWWGRWSTTAPSRWPPRCGWRSLDAPGVLGLSIASAEAAAEATPATPTTPPKTPDQDRSLPSTGGEVHLTLTLALLAAAWVGLLVGAVANIGYPILVRSDVGPTEVSS